ncbi:MAG TPA: 8-amino-7-oxononanoate synthase [Candidatus Parabacteroides intestinavium]|nr:8-amino-7-oxononanoate synthase [Candidatus Parabacteroides intestinavium]
METYKVLLETLERAGNLRSLPLIEPYDKWIIRDGRKMLNLSSNDYLGLSRDMQLRKEFLTWAMEEYLPLSSTSSRLLTGNYPVYTELEKALASAYGKESALVFNSGYHANVGILPALADKETLILTDKLVHASLIDGIRLSGATYKRFRHQDYEQAEQILQASVRTYKRIILVTESIFSMDGDIADLHRLVRLKQEYPNVLLYVDEAHAIGVRGKTGLGIAEESGTLPNVDLLVGTFGKALASMGAFVACSRLLHDVLVNRMRPLIFSTALPPLQVAWTSYLFQLLPHMEERRKHLQRLSASVAQALQGKGGEISSSHIIPYIVKDSEDCLRLAEFLQRKGFYCLAIRPPTVPQGTARLRLSITADMDEENIRPLNELLVDK